MHYHASRKYGQWGFFSRLFWVLIKAPWNEPLFSERYGLRKPLLKFRGWRLFMRLGPHKLGE